MTTHHDLLVRIDADFNRAYQLTLSKELEKIICRNLKALRAVVELHKPVLDTNLYGLELDPPEVTQRYECQECGRIWQFCPTIEAIEKELMMNDMKYGPQTYQIEKLIIKIKSLTPEQIDNLTSARDDAWDAAWDAAWGAALDAARDDAWDATWDAARDAAWGAAWGAARYDAWGAAWGAAWGTALALVSRDLIGEKFTQAHYDLLTKAWRDVIGEFEEPEETKKEPKPLLLYETIYRWLEIDVITKDEARRLLEVEKYL